MKEVKLGVLLIQFTETETEEVIQKYNIIFSTDPYEKGSLKKKLNYQGETGFICLDHGPSQHFLKHYFHTELKNDKYGVEKQ